MDAQAAITVPVTLDKKTFQHFGRFDTFRRQKRWRLPIWFMAIMLGFATYIFFQTDKAQSGLIGGVLTGIGLSLPIVYFSSFFLTLRENVKKYGLPRRVYTLKLTDQDVYIHSEINKDEQMTLPWDKLFAAWRAPDAVYLYVLPSRAFILPAGQADAPDDALWALITARLPADRCRDLRRGGSAA